MLATVLHHVLENVFSYLAYYVVECIYSYKAFLFQLMLEMYIEVVHIKFLFVYMCTCVDRR